MNRITTEIERLRTTLPDSVELVAVSKYHPSDAIRCAHTAGQLTFGESRVQELLQKREELKDLSDIAWHFIGHLQRNKVKYIAPFISLIHSVDSIELLREINKQGERCHRKISCLLELHVADESTKSGMTPEECLALLEMQEWRKLPHVHIQGMMAMATFTDDKAQIRTEFHRARECFLTARHNYFADDPAFRICSWGMSDDYHIALTEGSNCVRIGTDIFGPREY